MSKADAKQAPIFLRSGRKTDLRTQFAALCYRLTGGKPEFLLITSRGTGRWIIPKGWPEDGKTPAEIALKEAWEEAGVKGRIAGPCLGLYSYLKKTEDEGELPCVAMVHPLRVETLADDFPEAGQRKRRWMSARKAAASVAEPELSQIFKNFDPKLLKAWGA